MLVLLPWNKARKLGHATRTANTALHEASLQSHLPCVDALLNAGMQTSILTSSDFIAASPAVRRFWETSGESRADRWRDNVRLSTGCCVPEPRPSDAGQRRKERRWCQRWKRQCRAQQVFNTHHSRLQTTVATVLRSLKKQRPPIARSAANRRRLERKSCPSEVTRRIPPLDTPPAATALARQSPSSSHTPASPPGSLSALLPWHPPAFPRFVAGTAHCARLRLIWHWLGTGSRTNRRDSTVTTEP